MDSRGSKEIKIEGCRFGTPMCRYRNKGEKMKLKIANIIICSATASAVLVSFIFLSEILSISSELLLILGMLIVPVFYAVIMVSENMKTVLLKWAVSLPLTYLWFNYFWAVHYAIRALNWASEGYGRQSAGGNFAGFIEISMFILLCGAGLMFALNNSSEKIKAFCKKQTIIGLAVFVVNALIVVCLERQFMPYELLMRKLNS